MFSLSFSYSKLRNVNRNDLRNSLSSFCIRYHHHLQGQLANRKQHAERIYLQPGKTKLRGMAGQPEWSRPRWPRSSGLCGSAAPTEYASIRQRAPDAYLGRFLSVLAALFRQVVRRKNSRMDPRIQY